MNTISKDITDAIERNLPTSVGSVLQEVLKKAQLDAAKVVSLQSEVTCIRDANKKHIDAIRELEDRLKAHRELSARKAALDVRENRLELYEARIQLESSRENTKFARDVALGLVRNLEYRSNVHETLTKQVSPYSNTTHTADIPFSDTRTTVTESSVE
jgi:hypothetical protein